MFQSYNHRYLGEINGQHTCQCEITDSEFGTVSNVVNRMEIEMGAAAEVVSVVIQEYSKRNLNVAANLVILFVLYNEQFNWSIQKIIDHNKKCNPIFLPYEKDLQKYLLLI
jgi:hypothetical protein